jgi:hypothetical protein
MKTIIGIAATMLLTTTLTSTHAATLLSWGPTSDLPNGVLGLTSLAVNGPEIRFTNPGGGGFDVGFSIVSGSAGLTGSTGMFGTTDELLLPNPPAPAGGNYIYFNPASGSNNTIYFETRFYATGTNNPVDVKGFKTQLEDVERGGSTTREWIVGPKIVTQGVTMPLLFTDTSIFDVPNGTLGRVIESLNVFGEPVQRAVPGFGVAGGTQPGKTLGIDLADTPLSYFRIGTSRTDGGSWLMGTLGEISVVPEPASYALAGTALAFALAARRRRGIN